MRLTTTRITALAALLLLSAACGKKDADDAAAGTASGTAAGTAAGTTAGTTAGGVSVTDVRLGKAVDASNRVADETDDFKKNDMIYASVITNGAAPSAAIHARWTFQDGQLVDSATRTIAPTGEAATSFHIMKPGGFPKGKYKLTVLVNGTEARTKDFEVED